ncbi:MAG: T9SS type A sorting domain-containing protein [Flavobacterium sp.]|nr:T9SS type A sorting domain-containing protein [Flavobacterium sp.]
MKRILLLVGLFITTLCARAQYSAGNLVVTRVGDGSTALSSTSTTLVNLLEFAPTGTAQTPVSTTALTGVTALGASNAVGQISLSANGKCLVFMGFDQPAATSNTTANAGNKKIIRIASDRTYNSTTNFPTVVGVSGVTSFDGNQFWMNAGTNSTSGGANANYMGYATLGQTTTPAYVEASGPGRVAGFVGNQLFTLRAFENVYAYTPSVPTSTVIPVGSTAVTGTATKAIAFNMSPNLSTDGFVFFDLDPAVNWNGTGFDVLYLSNVNTGLEKYYWNGNDWKPANSQYNLKISSLSGGSGYVTPPTVTIGRVYAPNTAFLADEVVKGTDNKCYRVATAGTTDATATLSTTTNVTIGTANFVFVGNTYPTATAIVSGGVVTDVVFVQGHTSTTLFSPTITFIGGTPTVDATATIVVANNAYGGGHGGLAQITGKLNGTGDPVIYAIKGSGTAVGGATANDLIAITDNSGRTNSMTYTSYVSLATPGTGYAFRGVAFTPQGILSTSSFEKKAQSWSMYPNPSKGILNIDSEVSGSFSVYNVLGQKVHQFKLENGSNTINVDKLNNGTYFVEGANATQKLIIQK